MSRYVRNRLGRIVGITIGIIFGITILVSTASILTTALAITVYGMGYRAWNRDTRKNTET